MAIQFRPTRTDVSRSFPVLGFTVRTGTASSTFEVALASDPALLRSANRAQRAVDTFWSSRGRGPIPAPRGEAVFVVPPDVLARFVGKPRLYYGIAVFRGDARGNPEISLAPEDAAPFVVISESFDGRVRRIGTGHRPADSEYGKAASPDSLMWATDDAAPGSLEPLPAPQTPAASSPVPPVDAGGGVPPAPPAGATTPAAASQGLAYSDGLGDRFWEQLEAEIERGDNVEVGPIPDDPSEAYGAVLAAESGQAPEDPFSARFVPASSSNYRAASRAGVDRIVVHITDGGAKIGGPVSWFQNPTAGVSAHYIVGQDGEIVQMVRHRDVAWHANSANGTSIGIEHVANTRGLVPTAAQYEASARLVRWLCDRFAIPVDRDHVLGHSEADTRTTHSACPNSVWDWTTYMGLVAGGVTTPAATSEGLSGDSGARPRTSAALEETMDLYYDDCYLVPQPTNRSCWAAAMTMVYSWTQRASFDPTALAAECARIDEMKAGLPVGDNGEVASRLGLVAVWPQSYSVQGFFDLLSANGPLYIGVAVPSGHAVVVVGLHGDGTPEGTTVIYHDPWPPAVGAANQRKPYTEFMTEYENRACGDAATPAFPQIVHGDGRRRSAALSLGLGMPQRAPGHPGTLGHGGGHDGGYGGGTATLVRPQQTLPAVAGGIAGSAAAAVLGNNGDVSWSLTGLVGPHHPGGNPALAGRGPYLRSGPIRITGPRGTTFAGADEIYADFDITWEQNGRSIGNVVVTAATNGSNDAAGAALRVDATAVPMMTQIAGPATNPTATSAGVHVQLTYAFTYSWAGNTTAVTDVELHGDGTYTETHRW